MDVGDVRRKLLEAAADQAGFARVEDADDAQGHAKAARELVEALAVCNEIAHVEGQGVIDLSGDARMLLASLVGPLSARGMTQEGADALVELRDLCG